MLQTTTTRASRSPEPGKSGNRAPGAPSRTRTPARSCTMSPASSACSPNGRAAKGLPPPMTPLRPPSRTMARCAMTAETIARALGGHRAGATWMARCLVHEDRSPSLSISAGNDGKVLVRCHAGCDQRDLIAALLERGLWQTTVRASGIARKPRRLIAEQPDAEALRRSAAALAIWQASHAAEGTPVAAYLRSRGLDFPVLPALRFHAGL